MASSEMTSSWGLGPRGSPLLDTPLLPMPSLGLLLQRLPLLLTLPLGLELRGLALGEDGCSLWEGGGSCSWGLGWWWW